MVFWNKKKTVVTAPCEGEIVALTEVPDPIFSKSLMGEGFAVKPTSGEFRAPVSGEIVMIAETLHTYTVKSDEGAEVLVHIGIDSVGLKGEGFSSQCKRGDRVEAGDTIVTVNLEAVTGAIPSLITPVVCVNMKDYEINSLELDNPEAPMVIKKI